ncbi:hypothetical protein B566_EDAN009423 [Ephemera danica]|nr:hypothetical protein B566_EDAN009423 [Ephemera danica]
MSELNLSRAGRSQLGSTVISLLWCVRPPALRQLHSLPVPPTCGNLTSISNGLQPPHKSLVRSTRASFPLACFGRQLASPSNLQTEKPQPSWIHNDPRRRASVISVPLLYSWIHSNVLQLHIKNKSRLQTVKQAASQTCMRDLSFFTCGSVSLVATIMWSPDLHVGCVARVACPGMPEGCIQPAYRSYSKVRAATKTGSQETLSLQHHERSQKPFV